LLQAHLALEDDLEDLELAVLDALGDLDLTLTGEQRNRAHLAQVHAHRVVRLGRVAVVTGDRGRALHEGRWRDRRDLVFVDRRAIGERGGAPEGLGLALFGCRGTRLLLGGGGGSGRRAGVHYGDRLLGQGGHEVVDVVG